MHGAYVEQFAVSPLFSFPSFFFSYEIIGRVGRHC